MAKIIITIEDTSNTGFLVTDEGDTIANPTQESTLAQIFAWFVVKAIQRQVFETGGKLVSLKD